MNYEVGVRLDRIERKLDYLLSTLANEPDQEEPIEESPENKTWTIQEKKP